MEPEGPDQDRLGTDHGEQEVHDLAVSTLGLGLAFTLMLYVFPGKTDFLFSLEMIPAYLATTVLVAVSFLPHEMTHRVMARSMEAYTEYRLWPGGVVVGILSGLLGVVFAAPGGLRVYKKSGERYGRKSPSLNPDNMSMIALMGPLMNISIAILFVFGAAVAAPQLYGVELLWAGAKINAWIALSTLVPVYPLDGYRVFRANEMFYVLAVLLSILTLLVSYQIL